MVANFPGAIPDGFDDAISVMIGNALHLNRLSATSTPARRLAPVRGPAHPHSLGDRSLRGRGLPRPPGPAVWTRRTQLACLAGFSRRIRTSEPLSAPLLGRSLFLLAGRPLPNEPASEVGVVDMTWDGNVDNVDLLLLANEKLRERNPDPLLRSLLANTVARVAAWDYDTAANLLVENDQTIMDPTEMLRASANEKGWTTDTPHDWRLGTASRTGVAHPARAALEDPPTEIEHRLWSAQLAVLLPWIEERRHDVVSGNIYQVKQQMRIDGDGQGDPYDIEVGDLYALFARRGGHRGIRKTLQSLRDGRNVLAHRRRMSYDRVLKLIASPSSRPGVLIG